VARHERRRACRTGSTTPVSGETSIGGEGRTDAGTEGLLEGIGFVGEETVAVNESSSS
jgi:hypothetical protein